AWEVVAYHGIETQRGGLRGARCCDLEARDAEARGEEPTKNSDPKERRSVENLLIPQQVREVFLVRGIVRLPLAALFRRDRLIFAGPSVKTVIDVLKHFGDRGRFHEFAYARKRGDCAVKVLGARL